MINVDDRLIKEVQPLIGAEATMLLLTLSSYINDKKVCFPSNNTLQELTGFGRNKVQKLIKILCNHNLLKVRQVKEKGTGKFGKRYFILQTSFISYFVNVKGTVFEPLPEIGASDNTATPKTDARETVNPNRGTELINKYNTIVEFLNSVTNSNFSSKSKKTKSCIRARIEEGFSIEDFKLVIESKNREWGNDSKMSEYLRPQTLFGTNFESYLQHAKRSIKIIDDEGLNETQKQSFNQFNKYLEELTNIDNGLSSSEFLNIININFSQDVRRHYLKRSSSYSSKIKGILFDLNNNRFKARNTSSLYTYLVTELKKTA